MNKEELDLLESVFTLAIGECAYNDINNIQKLEYKIKTINNLCKKQKEIIDKAIEYIKRTNIEVLKYDDEPSEMTSYEIVTVDLLKILEGKD